MVDRRVGLQGVVDREAVRCGDPALDRADDPSGCCAIETERVADRDDFVTHLRQVGVPERQRRQRAHRRIDLQHRDVRRRIGADDRGAVRGLIREADLDLGRALDNVEVRHDVAGLIEHEARAERLIGRVGERCAEERVGARFRVGAGRRRDLHDARSAAAVNLVDRKGRRGCDRRGCRARGCRCCALDDCRRARRCAELAEECCPSKRRTAAKESGGGKCGDWIEKGSGHVRRQCFVCGVYTRRAVGDRLRRVNSRLREPVPQPCLRLRGR